MRPETGILSTQGPVARIRTNSGEVCGAGLLVGERHVVTCAHVIDYALPDRRRGDALAPGEAERVTLDMPFLDRRGLTARVVAWHPTVDDVEGCPVSDIAVLELEESVPGGLDPREAVLSAPPAGTAFITLGFPRNMDGGAEAQGELRMRDAGGWRHIQDTQDYGYFVEPGFSGAPVFDAEAARHGARRLLGMVVAADRDADKRLAFVIPTPTLGRAWPLLVRPYKGLFAFEADDADLFFGRKKFVDELKEKIERHPVLSVIGPSGAGKSSVVKAGLVPRLLSDGGWAIATCRPGRRPLYRMAHALEERAAAPDDTAGIINRRAAELEALLRAEPDRIVDHVETLLQRQPGATRLLLVIDQFEELFTHDDPQRAGEEGAVDASARQAEFIAVLAAISRQSKAAPLRAILTLRADFVGRALQNRMLADLMRDADVKLGPMTAEELAEAVKAPATRFEVDFDPDLLTQIVGTTVGAAGSLPLLQFALDRLWQRQRDRRITKAAYDEIGGVEGALNEHAERVFAGLNGEEKAVARRILTRLVRLATGEQAQDTKAIVSRDEIGDSDWELVERLSDERLVMTGRDPATGNPTAELVHEALISFGRRTRKEAAAGSREVHSWDRLTSWLDEDRTFALWRQRLRHDVERWNSSNDDALLRGALLAEAEEWMKERADDLNEAERTFIEAGIARREAGLAAEMESQRIEAEKEKKQREDRLRLLEEKNAQQKRFVRRLGVLAITLVGALLGAAYFGWRADIARADAQAAATESLGRQLAAEARVVANEVPGARAAERAAAMSIEAWRRHPTSQAYQVAAQSMRELPVARIEHGGPVVTLAFSPDGTRLATISEDGIARILDAKSGGEIARVRHGDPIGDHVISPDGARLATFSEDGTARILDARAGEEIARVTLGDSAIALLALSPDSSYLATGSINGTARILDLENGNEITRISHGDSINTLAFSPDGTRLATGSDDGTVRILEAETGDQVASVEHGGPVRKVVFSPNGTRLATANDVPFTDDGIAHILDASKGQQIVRIEHGSPVTALSFSPDGTQFAIGGAFGPTRIFDAKIVEEIARIEHDSSVSSLAFSPNSAELAIAEQKGSIQIFAVAISDEIARINHGGKIESLIFSPDGARLATAVGRSTRILDAATGGEITRIKLDEAVRSLAFSDAGSRIAIGSDFNFRIDGAAHILITESGDELTRIEHASAVSALAFSPKGAYLATGSADGVVRILGAPMIHEIARIESGGSAVTSLAFSSSGVLLATGYANGIANIRNAENGHEIAVIRHGHAVDTLTFSPDGDRLLTSGSDGTVRIVVASTGNKINEIKHGNVSGITAFSPDSRVFASGNYDGTIQVFDTGTGKEIFSVARGGMVDILAFSPQGRHLASGSGNGAIRVIDARNGNEVAFIARGDRVSSLAYSPDGARIATGSEDGTVRIFDADPDQLFRRLCTKRAGRNLTRDEWRRYISRDEPWRETCPGWQTVEKISE